MSEVCGPSSLPCPTKDDKISWSMFLDKNLTYIKFAVLGTGFLGFWSIARSIRLTQKFRTIADIPSEFYAKNFKLFGIIRNVTPSRRPDSTSMVDVEFLVEHIPIAQYPRPLYALKQKFDQMRTGKVPEGNLLIRLPGVKMNKRYLDAIRQRSVFQRASFVLLDKRKDQETEHILAQIFLKEQRRLFPKNVDLGHFIVDNGFGSVTPAVEHPGISESRIFQQYYAKMLKLEEVAAKKKKGMWSDPGSEDSGLFSSSTGIARRFFKHLQKIYFEKYKKGNNK